MSGDLEKSNFLKKKIEKSSKVYGPFIILVGILSVYIYFFSYLGSDYSPYYGDEFFYFKNSESFYLTNSLKASFTYSGNGSKIFGTDAHGPAYPLIYGSMSKLIGWNGKTIPLINLGILFLAILALLFQKDVKLEILLTQFILILGSPFTLFYSITYLPELIQISGGIGLYVLLRRYLFGKGKVDFLILVVYILVLGSIRSTWFFALFGLIVLLNPLRNFAKSLLFILGLLIPFLFQHFLHEQVPNIFSGFGELVDQRDIWSGLDAVLFNLKRNIYFAITFSEGHFYLVQKLWITATLLYSIFLARENKTLQFGVVVLISLMIFNFLLYKNYDWTDLRMYTPLSMFLNLEIISVLQKKLPAIGLHSFNFLSFILILPFQQKLVNFRVQPETKSIPADVIHKIQEQNTALVFVDSLILENYKLYELPVLNSNSEPLHYILPYYAMPTKAPSHYLLIENSQLTIKSVKILSQ